MLPKMRKQGPSTCGDAPAQVAEVGVYKSQISLESVTYLFLFLPYSIQSILIRWQILILGLQECDPLGKHQGRFTHV